MQTCTNLADALTNFGYLLYATGYNHGLANKSNPDRPQIADVTVHAVQIPTSVADNGNGLEHDGGVPEFFDGLLNKIKAEFGKLPNGDLDKLASAETVWKSFGSDETVAGAPARISAIADLLTGIDEPVTQQGVANDFATMRTAAEQLAGAAQVMAAPIGEYRTNTAETSALISSETTAFLIESGIVIGAAIAFSWLTVGGSVAAGTGGVIALAGDTAVTISRIYRASRLWSILGLAATATAVVAFDKVPDLNQITTGLASIIVTRARLDDYSVDDVNGSTGPSEAFTTSSMTTSVGKIARATGLTPEQVREAIHAVKGEAAFRGDGKNRNPDVVVDTATGEVYVKLPGGVASEDSIGNIFDHEEPE